MSERPAEPTGAEPSPGIGDESDDFWRGVLESQGVTREMLDQAQAEGTLELLALERVILLDTPRYTLDEVTQRSGVPEDVVRAFWRALGFPDPQPGERAFTDADVETLSTVSHFIVDESLDFDLALQMSRVIGSSMARIASAQVDAVSTRRGEDVPDQLDPEQEALAMQRSIELLPMLSTVMDYVWRRHLSAAARRRMMRETDSASADVVTVGFADLEGFTTLSQQLPEQELAEVVNRFETIAFDVVNGRNGRVIKMIGDEVMFMAHDVREGVEIALALAEAYAADDALSDVRVGLGCGRALQRDGDVFGPPVNLASRIVSIAYPGTVVVSPEVFEALEDDPAYKFRPLRAHHLRHIGRVRLWSVRRATDTDDEKTLTRAKDRRQARRAWIAEMMADRVTEAVVEQVASRAGDVTERTMKKVLRADIDDGDEIDPEDPDPEDPDPDG